MADNNKKYGRLLSDETYIQRVLEDARDKPRRYTVQRRIFRRWSKRHYIKLA